MNAKLIETLVNGWMRHCAERGGKHRPETEGGKATYRFGIETGRIFCCFPGCDWKAHSIDQAVKQEAQP